MFSYVNKEYLNAISKQIVKMYIARREREWLEPCVCIQIGKYAWNMNMSSIEYWALSIRHGTHCVFLDDYWASRSRFLLIFMKLSYVSICQHCAAIKKILYHSPLQWTKKIPYFSSICWIIVRILGYRNRRLPKTILILQMSSNFTHLLCLFCSAT